MMPVPVFFPALSVKPFVMAGSGLLVVGLNVRALSGVVPAVTKSGSVALGACLGKCPGTIFLFSVCNDSCDGGVPGMPSFLL